MGEQLSMLDTMFLDLEQFDASAHMHIGAALIFEPPPGAGPPGLDALRERVRTHLGVLPRFTQQLSSPTAGHLKWLTWESADALDLDAHLRHAILPAPGGEAELLEWLSDFWSHRLDRHRPLWEMTLLEGLAGGRWALVTKTHHCLVDGIGSLDIGHLILDAMPDPPPRPLEPAAAPPATEGDHHGSSFWLSPELVVRGVRAGAGAVRHPRRSLSRVRAASELVIREEVIAAPQTSLNGPMSGTREFLAVRLDLAGIKAIKEHRGGTVNDVVLALCAGGLRHLLLARGETPPNGLRAQIPVNIRSEERSHALGNELTSLFVELPVDEPDPDERYRLVVARAERLKVGTQRLGGKTILDLTDMGPPLAGAMLARSMFGAARMFNLTITNVPGPQERLYGFGAPLVEVLPLVPLFAGHAIGIAAVSYAGQVTFGLNADRLAAPDVATLAEGIERSFEELAPAETGARRT